MNPVDKFHIVGVDPPSLEKVKDMCKKEGIHFSQYMRKTIVKVAKRGKL